MCDLSPLFSLLTKGDCKNVFHLVSKAFTWNVHSHLNRVVPLPAALPSLDLRRTLFYFLLQRRKEKDRNSSCMWEYFFLTFFFDLLAHCPPLVHLFFSTSPERDYSTFVSFLPSLFSSSLICAINSVPAQARLCLAWISSS